MYYKIEKGTDLFIKINDFFKRLSFVRSEAFKIVKEVGLGHEYIECTGFHSIAGGLGAFKCSGEKPNNFKWYDKSRGLVVPKVKEKCLVKRMESLPVLKDKDMHQLIDYRPKKASLGYGRFRTNNIYSLYKVDKVFLIKIPEKVPYTPIEGMTEILYSEYQKLKGKG